GLYFVFSKTPPWKPTATSNDVRTTTQVVPQRIHDSIDELLRSRELGPDEKIRALFSRATVHLYEGHAKAAYLALEEARIAAESSPDAAANWLYSIYFTQG